MCFCAIFALSLFFFFPLQVRKREKAAVREGKQPYYLKQSVRKQLELVERFKDLEKSGGVDKFLAKKRKRNAAKDHRLLPSDRRDAD